MWRYTNQDELYHVNWKYLDKYKKNGKWIYVYNKPKQNTSSAGRSGSSEYRQELAYNSGARSSAKTRVNTSAVRPRSASSEYAAERAYNSKTNTVGKSTPSAKVTRPVAPKNTSSEYASEKAYNSRANQMAAKKTAAIPAKPSTPSNPRYSKEEARNQSDISKKPVKKEKSFLDKIGDWGRNAAEDVGNAASKAAKDTKNWAKNAADDVGDWGRQAAKDVEKAADNAGKAASKAAKDTKNWVKNAADDVGDWTKKAASDVSKAAKNAYDRINEPDITVNKHHIVTPPNPKTGDQRIYLSKDTNVGKGKIDKAKDWVNDLFGKKKKKKNYRVDRLK